MLTEEQKKPVYFDGQHALVRAVAGSGKSHMLTYRIQYLVEECDVDPNGILVLMFNVSAADMFRERLQSLNLEDVHNVFTFHSFAKQLHDEYRDHYKEWYHIMDDSEEQDLFKDMVYKWNQKGHHQFVTTRHELYKLYQEMDYLKNFDVPHNLNLPYSLEFFEEKIAFLYMWNHERRRQKKMGMTDLLYDLVNKCRLKPEFLTAVQGYFSHLIVDEYQDTNALQQWLLTHLADVQKGGQCELMCVGDEDQCIYAFRGSDPQYMSNMFFNDFPKATEFTLSRTFRYGHAIALLANQSIAQNMERSIKWCISGVPNKLSETKLIHSDAHGSEIMHNFLQGKLRGATILVRSHHHGDDIELAFWRQGYSIQAMKPFWERGAGKFIRLMLEVRKDHRKAIADYDALFFLLKWVYPQADRTLTEYGISLLTNGPFFYRLQNAQINLDIDASLKKPFAVMEEIVKHFLPGGSVNHISDIVQVLMQYTKSNMSLWMQEMNQWHDDLSWLERQLTLPLQKTDIQLTTIHQSKGQGYPFVIVPHVEKGMFPSKQANAEEERRLYYVALTRAEEKLWVLTAPEQERQSLFIDEEAFDYAQQWGDFWKNGGMQPFKGSTNKHVIHYANEIKQPLEKKSQWSKLKKAP